MFIIKSMEAKKLGEFIKQQRNLKALTRRSLSEKLGITEGHLNNIERGDRIPSHELMFGLARELRVPSGYLMEILEGKNQSEKEDEDENPLSIYIKDKRIAPMFSKPYLSKVSNKTWRQIAAILKEEFEGEEENGG